MIESIITPKHELVMIPETMNCHDAIILLEEQGLRNAPVVDKSERLFRGNIYRFHIYKYAFHQGHSELKQMPVTRFLKNSTRVVHTYDSIFQILFAIRDLPYIGVLNEDNRFVGVIFHEDLMHYLAEAWGADEAHYMLAITLPEAKMPLWKLTRIVERFIQPIGYQFYHHQPAAPNEVYLVIDRSEDPLQVNALIHRLRKRHYLVEEYHW